jgi:hypothetical protein
VRISDVVNAVAFQCHHGVPASGLACAFPAHSGWFQCHHGVPASTPIRSSAPNDQRGFNATTAFLLPEIQDMHCSVQQRFNATTAFLLRRT